MQQVEGVVGLWEAPRTKRASWELLQQQQPACCHSGIILISIIITTTTTTTTIIITLFGENTWSPENKLGAYLGHVIFKLNQALGQLKMVTAAMKLKHAGFLEEKLWQT